MLDDGSSLGISLRLLLVLFLVASNGFFVAAEFSLVSVRKTRIDELVAEGNRRARVVRRSLRDLDSYIAATQLGITMSSLALGWVGEPALAALLDPIFASILSENAAFISAHTVAFIVAFSIITVLHIVFGELAPKTVALQRSAATALWIAAPLEVFLRIFRPIIWAMNGLGRMVVQSVGLQDTSGHGLIHSEAELRMLVTASAQGGHLEETEQEIIDRAFMFHDDVAADVMLPRTEMVAFPLDATPEQARQMLTTYRMERYPVYEGSSDHIAGILHARDALAVLASGETLNIADLLRPVLQVPTTIPLDRLLESMREARTHIAVAIDEFGGTAGIIELEQVMARLVGALPDEFTPAHAYGEGDNEDDLVAEHLDGLTLVQDVNDAFDMHLDEERAHTIGGLVFYELGRAALLGDTVELDNARFVVTDLDGLRVAGLRMEKQPRTDERDDD